MTEIKVRIDIPKIPLFDNQGSASVIRRELTDAVQDSINLADSALVKFSPVGITGRFHAGWQPSVQITSQIPARIQGQVFNATPYAPFANAGRGPGKFPPFGPGSDLARWVGRVLGADVPVFPIARRIARQGTVRFRTRALSVIAQALKMIDRPVKQRFQRAGERIARRLRGLI